MANLNLSQFGENTSVSDADYTFVWDSAASISKKVSRNSWLNSGTLTSDAPVTISQTWNNAAVVFTGLKFNAAGTSDANSASGSLLLDLQVGGVSKIRAGKIGDFWAGSPFGGYQLTNGSTRVSGWGANQGGSLGGLGLASSFVLGWSSGADGGNFETLDTILLRDGAANTLALRNGAAAQTFRLYNTYTDASNWEVGFLSFSSNIFNIGTHASGSGSFRKLAFYGNGIDFYQAGIGIRWSINTSGHFIAAADNSYDIGASGANRPRNVYVGSQLTVGTFATFGSYIYAENYYFSTTKGLLAAPSDGVFTFSNRAATDFNRLQFGGTTNLFPAIKRNAAGLQIRLADDSANATLETGNLYASGNVGIGTTAPGAKLHITGGDNATTFAAATIALGFGTVGNYPHFIHTRHAGVAAGNCIDFYTCDGLITGTYPTNAVHGLTIENGKVGIGTTSPTSKLQVSAGDVEVDTIAKGVILKSPDGTRYRVTVANGGTLSVAAV